MRTQQISHTEKAKHKQEHIEAIMVENDVAYIIGNKLY